MANLRDIAWLRKGCQEWNKRRTRCSNWRPDLSDVDISKCLKEKGRVTDSGKPDLRGYDLSSCNLEGSSLCDADLSGADLSGANLTCADISGSKLWKANFPTLDNQRLSHRRLDGFENKKIKSIADLLKCVEKLDAHYRRNTGPELPILYYRGESNFYKNMIPSVMRSSGCCEYPFRGKESELLVDLMTRRPDNFAEEPATLGKLMIAQHHHLPTRLLDVTRNPLVALFNATYKARKCANAPYGRIHILVVPRPMVKPYISHTVSVIANFTRLKRGEQNLLLTKTAEYTRKRCDCPPSSSQTPLRSSEYRSAMARLVQFVKLEHSSFEDRIDPFDLFRVFVVEPQRSIERIRAQSGAFLLSAFHERFDEKEVRKIKCGVPVYHQYTLKVPHKQKKTLMQQLSTLNITEETMYPGLEKSAKAVKRQYSG